jgi:hypothetical protein
LRGRGAGVRACGRSCGRTQSFSSLRIPLGKLRNDRYVPLHPELVTLLADWTATSLEHIRRHKRPRSVRWTCSSPDNAYTTSSPRCCSGSLLRPAASEKVPAVSWLLDDRIGAGSPGILAGSRPVGLQVVPRHVRPCSSRVSPRLRRWPDRLELRGVIPRPGRRAPARSRGLSSRTAGLHGFSRALVNRERLGQTGSTEDAAYLARGRCQGQHTINGPQPAPHPDQDT